MLDKTLFAAFHFQNGVPTMDFFLCSTADSSKISICLAGFCKLLEDLKTSNIGRVDLHLQQRCLLNSHRPKVHFDLEVMMEDITQIITEREGF